MKILSFCWCWESTAALLLDGRIVACVSEERFSRQKSDGRYPCRAIEAVLEMGNVKPQELDAVVFPGLDFAATYMLCNKWNYNIADRLLEEREYWYPKFYEKKSPVYLDVFKHKIDVDQYPGPSVWADALVFLRKPYTAEEHCRYFQQFIRNVVSKHLGIDPQKVHFVLHHRAHAYYSYFAGVDNHRDRTLILTSDAWGDGMNATVSLADKGRIQMLSHSANSITGRLYRSMTLLLGMKPDEHEYKVMGLAAYAKETYYEEALQVFRNTMYVDGLGFAYKITPPDLYQYFKKKFEGVRFDSIAGALQQYTEEIVLQWVSNALQHTGARKICFSGGVGMNVKAMMQLAQLPQVDEFHVLPSPGDQSLPIGAAYVYLYDHLVSEGETLAPGPWENAYFGPELSSFEIKESLECLDEGYRVSDSFSPGYVAELISQGKIIGRCIGHSEFGPRALGNRSILADPRNTDVVDKINQKIKCRDFWMPFASTILDSAVDKYLILANVKKAPFMTIAFPTTLLGSQCLKAAIHRGDNSCRPQILTKSANADYYKLIEAFAQITGVESVLNTSLNIHGEPIVQTSKDALSVLIRSDLDALILDNYLVERIPKKE